ncbi:MAG: SurA N-terminal domain-containing protein [Chitinophagaceae bacterium]|nr:SurA N-terminal domain-containing protein [Chitinophagaceae bacterium]
MQIIQKIRDKGAAIVIAVIALSLIGFILMDANLGMSRNGGAGAASIGKINGKAVDTKEFQDKVKAMEEQYGGRVSGSQIYQLRQNVWDQLVFEKVVESEFDKLGLSFSPKELSSIIFSDEAPQSLKQAFSDKTTGQYDLNKVQQWWTAAKKFKGEQKEAVENQVVAPIRLQSMYTKYSGLIAASAYYPTWMKEKEAAESKTFANISYVQVPYSQVNDSTVKVTDEDIMSYVGKHKALYKQDGGRQVAYVNFSTNPSSTDTAAVLESVATLKAAFAADSNEKVFVSKNMSARDFQDIYTLKSSLPAAQKDTLASLSAGTVYGPYLDGSEFVIAKILGSRQLPDSVKCRHILISTQPDPQTGVAKITDSAAKKKIDSIEAAINGGADFNALVLQYSDDPGSKDKKGEYDFPYYSASEQNPSFATLAKEFAEAIFYGVAGDKKVIKTSFGYHYIEVINQRNFEPAYKIAYVAKNIAASQETMNMANAKASKLSGEARSLKAFDDYVTKNKLQKNDGTTLLKENDYRLGNLDDARQLIKWAFEAKEGDVSEPFNIGDQFVVAAVNKVVPQGLPDAKTIRPQVEFMVRNEKKAAIIKTKLAPAQTLEAAAAAYNVPVGTAGADSSLTFSSGVINGVGNEPKLIGAAFNKAYQTKLSEPIAGNNGVYVLKVNGTGVKNMDVTTTDKVKTMAQQLGYGWYEGLKKLADIKDERSKANY